MSNWQFGLIVAYILPGLVALVGVAPLLPGIYLWLRPMGSSGAGVAMYAVPAAAATGLIVSCFRWLILDQIHAWTGICRATLDDRRLPEVLVPFDYLVQNHFRYYEFCGNTLVASIAGYLLNRCAATFSVFGWETDVVVTLISIALFAASRDALVNYFVRTSRLVGVVATKGSEPHVQRK